ncbi:integrase, catalytic region [Mycolicibacterium brisbanense]|uniref:Integrase, catalytic region n=1 Tax=Mycolicibacterium brisbanense TaxID=146020 RepID=A0A100VYA4_9MYCO|nr:integrase, catalytic region [Mycolicibacterium brisbanense]
MLRSSPSSKPYPTKPRTLAEQRTSLVQSTFRLRGTDGRHDALEAENARLKKIDADRVVDVLDRLELTHGAPHYVRFDNGPEPVAHAVAD